MTPERRANISKALKGNVKLSEAMKKMHARRLASGEDIVVRKKIRATRIAKGDWTEHDRSAWLEYCKEVRNVTENQPLHLLKNFDKRGRGAGKFHLDHIVSKKVGFDLKFPAWFIGHISNLQMLPENENCSKQQRTDEDDLIRLWFSLTEVIDV
jgi:hypothetical protein